MQDKKEYTCVLGGGGVATRGTQGSIAVERVGHERLGRAPAGYNLPLICLECPC